MANHRIVSCTEESLSPGQWRNVDSGSLSVSRSGSEWHVVASVAFFEFGLFQLQTMFTARSEVVSYNNYGLHTAAVAATGIRNFQTYSRPRPRLELLILQLELRCLQHPAVLSFPGKYPLFPCASASLPYCKCFYRSLRSLAMSGIGCQLQPTDEVVTFSFKRAMCPTGNK